VRGKEALDMVDASNSGHEGTICTVHSNGREQALVRLARLCRRADMNFDRSDLYDAIGAVVHISLKDGRRSLDLWETKS
jgi:pilus assembly protein CpaF